MKNLFFLSILFLSFSLFLFGFDLKKLDLSKFILQVGETNIEKDKIFDTIVWILENDFYKIDKIDKEKGIIIAYLAEDYPLINHPPLVIINIFSQKAFTTIYYWAEKLYLNQTKRPDEIEGHFFYKLKNLLKEKILGNFYFFSYIYQPYKDFLPQPNF